MMNFLYSLFRGRMKKVFRQMFRKKQEYLKKRRKTFFLEDGILNKKMIKTIYQDSVISKPFFILLSPRNRNPSFCPFIFNTKLLL